MWKIHEFYWAINNLQGHPTQEDWNDLKLVQSLVAATHNPSQRVLCWPRPLSTMPGTPAGVRREITVTNSGWKLFGQRLEQAKATLDEASALPSKCPEWYYAMQSVALGQGWDRRKVEELVERAIASEPGYYYYYRAHAYSLMPQWNGEGGDAARFAEQSADRVGGDAGDILYFQMARKSFARAVNRSSGDCRGRGFRRDTRYWRSNTAVTCELEPACLDGYEIKRSASGRQRL